MKALAFGAWTFAVALLDGMSCGRWSADRFTYNSLLPGLEDGPQFFVKKWLKPGERRPYWIRLSVFTVVWLNLL